VRASLLCSPWPTSRLRFHKRAILRASSAGRAPLLGTWRPASRVQTSWRHINLVSGQVLLFRSLHQCLGFKPSSAERSILCSCFLIRCRPGAAVDGGSLLAAIAILQCFSGDACSSSRLPADSSAGRALLLVDAGLPARARLWHSKVAAFLHADSWACDISSALVKLNAHGSRGSPAPSMRFTLAASTFCEKPWRHCRPLRCSRLRQL